MTTRDLDRIRFVTEHFTDLQGLRTALPQGMMLVGTGIMNFSPSWPRGILPLGLALFAGSFVMRFWARSYYRSFGEVKPRPAFLDSELLSLSLSSPAGPAPLAVERRPMNAMWLLPLSLLGVALVFLLRAVLPATPVLTDGSWVNSWAHFHVLDRPVGPSWMLKVESLLAQGMYAFFGTYLLSTWFQRGRRLSQSYPLVLGSLLLGLAALGSCLGLVLTERWNPELARVLMPSQAFRAILPLAYCWMAMPLCGLSLILAGLLDHLQLVRVLKPVREEEA